MRDIVVLLGMHRSGTSLAMSMLSSLGVKCGASLIPAGRSNEEGFWEHAGIVAVQENLLAGLQRVWHGPKGTHPMPTSWLDSPAARRARVELVRIVEQELCSTDGVWGFKDPRTTRLLPLWRLVFAEVRVRPHYVLSVRQPGAVARSLARHNGMDTARSRLAWYIHNLDALKGAGEDLKLVVDYDLLLRSPDWEVERMAGALHGVLAPTPAQLAEATARVLPSMRHNAAADVNIDSAHVRDAYECLLDMARGLPMGARLERQIASFDDVEQLLAPWLTDTRAPWLDWAIRLIVRRKYR